jgi:hypothetical protein
LLSRTDNGRLRNIEELFAGRHFDREVILLSVRWYLRYKPSFRDLAEMMADRGLHLTPSRYLHQSPENDEPISPFIFRPVVWLGARYSTDNQAVQQSSFYKPFLLHSLGRLFGSMRRGTRRAFVKSE